MKIRIPDRWLPYQALGQRIPGTRFISFKVPLTDGAFEDIPDDLKFTPEMLLKQCPALQFIVDLTNTYKYYNGKVFTERGLQYKKILTPGHFIPAANYVREFFDTVDAFLSMPAEPDSLIGVHCTHGLNRTSYFICCYMIHRMGFEPKDAIEAFEEARGHKIERNLYVEDLLKRGMGAQEVNGPVHRGVHRRFNPYDRPTGRERQQHSRWDNCAPAPYANPYTNNRNCAPAPAPAPYTNPYGRDCAPGPARYANPYARGKPARDGRSHYQNSEATEKSFGYSNYDRPAPTHHASRGHREGAHAQKSSRSTPYNDKLRARGRGRGHSSRGHSSRGHSSRGHSSRGHSNRGHSNRGQL